MDRTVTITFSWVGSWPNDYPDIGLIPGVRGVELTGDSGYELKVVVDADSVESVLAAIDKFLEETVTEGVTAA